MLFQHFDRASNTQALAVLARVGHGVVHIADGDTSVEGNLATDEPKGIPGPVDSLMVGRHCGRDGDECRRLSEDVGAVVRVALENGNAAPTHTRADDPTNQYPTDITSGAADRAITAKAPWRSESITHRPNEPTAPLFVRLLARGATRSR